MTEVIAVTGMDGTGKSSIIRQLHNRSDSVYGAGIAQHYLDENLPHCQRGRVFERLNRKADEISSSTAKASAMFLIMTLYGDIVRFVTHSLRPKYLFMERHAVIDAIVYASYYLSRMHSDDSQSADLPLTEEDRFEIDAWLKTVHNRWPEHGLDHLDSHNLTAYFQRLFQADSQEDLMDRLSIVFNMPKLDRIFLITADELTFSQRMSKRSGVKEPHEQAAELSKMQNLLQSVTAQYCSHTHTHSLSVSTSDEISLDDQLNRVYERALDSVRL